MTTHDDFDVDEFINQLEEDYPTSVSLNEGDVIVGKFVRIDKGFTREYGESPIFVFDGIKGTYVNYETGEAEKITTDERYGLWLFHETLKNRLADIQPTENEIVGIKYLGKKKGAKYEYHNYKVGVRRDQDTILKRTENNEE